MKPVHPIVVHFPIALLVLSVVADFIAFFNDNAALRNTGWWAMFGAAMGGVVTVAAGVFDMRRATLREEVHELVHQHMKVGIALLTAIIGLTLWRWTIYAQPALPVPALYLDAALLAVALAGFQGWLGGELVYTYGVFVKSVEPGAGAKGKADPKDAKGGHHH